MNCNECKNKILEGKESLCHEHIEKCKECQKFLKTVIFLKKTEKKLLTPKTTFKSILKCRNKEKSKFKKILLTAASIILIINIYIYINKPYQKQTEKIKIITENIENNFSIIEETLGSMESNIANDSIINDEINILSEQINQIS